MRVSKRIKTLVSLIPKDSTVVDIGCDHAGLLIYGIRHNIITKGYGIDIAKGPLGHALENVKQAKLENSIKLILANGLEYFKEEANCYVLAGMGTQTILDIIKNYTFEEEDTLIIQSNTKHSELRMELNNLGFKIKDEVFIIDKKIPVCMLSVSLGNQCLTHQEYVLGPVLMKRHNEDYIKHLNRRKTHLQEIVAGNENVMEEIEFIDGYLKGETYELDK